MNVTSSTPDNTTTSFDQNEIDKTEIKKYLILCKKNTKILPLNQQTHVTAPHRVTRFTRLPLDFTFFLNYGHWIMKCLKEMSNSVRSMIAGVRPIELHKETMTHDRLQSARNTCAGELVSFSVAGLSPLNLGQKRPKIGT